MTATRKIIEIDLRDGGEQRGLAAADEIAGLDLRGSDQSGNRRRHAGVAEIDRRLFDGRLRGIDLRSRRLPRRQGVVQFLLAHRLLRDERHVAQATSVSVFSSVACRSRLVRPSRPSAWPRAASDRFDIELALLDERSLAKIHALEKPFDARPDLDVPEPSGLPDQLEIDRHVLLNDGRDVDLGEVAPALAPRFLAAANE